MFKSIQILLAGILVTGLVACGGSGGGTSLDSTVQNARAKGVNIKLTDAVDYVVKDGHEFDQGEEVVVGRNMDSISLKSVGSTDEEMSAAIEALRAVDAMVEGSNLINKYEAHSLIENAIYDLQQKRKQLLDSQNGSVDSGTVNP